MNKVLRVPDYLDHILRAIERIDRYTADIDELGFLGSELIQDAVIRNIAIIGEASNNILRSAPDFAAQHSTASFLGPLCTPCAIAYHMDTIKWILRLFGRLSRSIFLVFMPRLKKCVVVVLGSNVNRLTPTVKHETSI